MGIETSAAARKTSAPTRIGRRGSRSTQTPAGSVKSRKGRNSIVVSRATLNALSRRATIATSGSASRLTCEPNWLTVCEDQSQRKSRCCQRPPGRLNSGGPGDLDVAAHGLGHEAGLGAAGRVGGTILDVELGADVAARGVDVEVESRARADAHAHVARHRLELDLPLPHRADPLVAGDGLRREVGVGRVDREVAGDERRRDRAADGAEADVAGDGLQPRLPVDGRAADVAARRLNAQAGDMLHGDIAGRGLDLDLSEPALAGDVG